MGFKAGGKSFPPVYVSCGPDAVLGEGTRVSRFRSGARCLLSERMD